MKKDIRNNAQFKWENEYVILNKKNWCSAFFLSVLYLVGNENAGISELHGTAAYSVSIVCHRRSYFVLYYHNCPWSHLLLKIFELFCKRVLDLNYCKFELVSAVCFKTLASLIRKKRFVKKKTIIYEKFTEK